MEIVSKKAIVTTEKLKAIAKSGVIWQPTGLYRRRLASKKATWTVLELECVCGACDTKYWVPWPRLRTLRSKMCRSCAMRVAKGGPLFPRSAVRNALYKKWVRMFSPDQKHVVNLFKNFDDFVKWALDANFKIGNEILRKKTSLPIGPDNCYCKTTGKEEVNLARNTVSVPLSTDTVSLF